MDAGNRKVISPKEYDRMKQEEKELAEMFEEVPVEHTLNASRLLNGRPGIVAHKDDAGANAMFRSSRQMKKAIRRKMKK